MLKLLSNNLLSACRPRLLLPQTRPVIFGHKPATTPSRRRAAPLRSCSGPGTRSLWQCVAECGECSCFHGNSLSAAPKKSLPQGFETRHGGWRATSRTAGSGGGTAESETKRKLNPSKQSDRDAQSHRYSREHGTGWINGIRSQVRYLIHLPNSLLSFKKWVSLVTKKSKGMQGQ